MNDAFDGGISRGLQDIEGTFDVRTDVGNGSVVRIRDSDERGEMKNDACGFHGSGNAVAIRDVAGDNFKVILVFGLVEPTPGSIPAVVHEGTNFRTGLDERLHEVAADKTAGSSDENAFSFYR